VTTETDKALAALREHWGERWEVWYVPHALDGSVTWCARRHGDKLPNVIRADTAGHLSEYMAEAEADSE
jgi:hypothetical protein